MKKRYFALALILCLALAALCGCFTEEDKDFSKAGMTITLTTRFTEKELASQTAYYESASAIVVVLKQEFSLGLEDYTLEKYTEAVIKDNNLSSTASKPEGKEYQSFSYEKTVSGKDFYYYATTFKGTDAFWLIQFACTTANKDNLQSDFDKWASSVKFD